VIIADTSLLFALLDRRDQHHADAVVWYERELPDLICTPLILAEVDHLAESRLGAHATHAYRKDVIGGAYRTKWWSGAEAEVAELADRYAGLNIGMADASLVALAGALQTITIATFDERHFRALRPLWGGAAFRLLPTDASSS
jgi:predicted nucleic acid-binding protein